MDTNTVQLTMEYPTGQELRDAGIARAEEHANAECPNWTERALDFVRQYPEGGT